MHHYTINQVHRPQKEIHHKQLYIKSSLQEPHMPQYKYICWHHYMQYFIFESNNPKTLLLIIAKNNKLFIGGF